MENKKNDEQVKQNDQNLIILGAERNNTQRFIAFFSILVVYFFYCYNFMLGTFVRPTLTAAVENGGFGFTLKQAESIFAVMSFGTIPGTILFGMLCSRIGKKRGLMTIAICIAATTFLPLLNPSNYTFWRATRFLAGFSLGGVFGAAVPLVAEMFPQGWRGKLAAIMTSTFSVAMIFAGQLYGFLGDENWRLLVYTAAIPPIVGAILVYFTVPDDYALMAQRRLDAQEHGEKISYFSMYKGKYLFIGIGVILLSGMNFVAYSSYANNATKFLRDGLGIEAAVAGTIYSLQGIGQLIGYNVWGLIADRFGRKVPAIGMFLCAILVFFFMQLDASNISSFKILSLALGFCIGFSGPWGAYYTELFPRRFSALSAGISFNGGRILSTFGLPLIAGLASDASSMPNIFKASMLIFAAGSVLWLFLPETLNKPRED